MRRRFLAALAVFAACLAPLCASAREKINDFTIEIDVRQNGDIIVTETIEVTVEGGQIKRGIFRDLPRYYMRDGVRYAYDYDVRRIERNGAREPYKTQRQGNAMQIRIGDADRFLDYGEHDYVIEYRAKNQVRYFDDYDEIYWNATGNYWNFEIDHARAVVRLPRGADVISTAAYTGREGANGRAYRHFVSGDAQVFETTQSLGRHEGLTVAVGFEKGVVDPPSAADRRGEWLQRNATALVLSGAIALLSLFYGWAFIRAGQDPAKGPVFPRYDPPEGLSPAATHHIYRRTLSGHDALIATVLNLGVKDAVKIDVESKKKTTLTRLEGGREEELSPAERNFLHGVFNGRRDFTLGEGYDSTFTYAYKKLQRDLGRKFGAPYFKWNAGYLIMGGVLSILATVAAISVAIVWTSAHTAALLVLVPMFAAFAYFIPAPTPHGQKIRTEIEGFRLYLKTAEKIYLDAVKVGSGAPPPMTVERYEKFLPYAVALGVEEPWTRHFERLIPEEAARYQPRWAGAHGGRYHSLHGLNSALVAGMASGVASALPQSSSSSGSGGGGFSGGGGGGGGGGGW